MPVPEPHLGGLLAGGVLQLFRPWPLGADGLLQLGLGGTLGLAGLAVVAWSVVTVGREDVSAPSSLVTAGPYRYSRNPMYVGWTGLYVGASLLADAAWPLVLFPAVALAVHLVVRREERVLETRFGDDYRRYRRDVRRYL